MLNLFGGPKSDHPMADLKEAKRLLEETQSTEAFKALDELAHWLESVRSAEGFKPEHSAQVTLLIDEAAQPHVRKLQRDYIANPRQSRFQEQRLWGAIYGYWAQAAQSFVAVIDLHASGVKGADALKNSLPLLAVRAVRALAAQMKWAYMRYGPFDETLWSVMARVYAVAESRKITQIKVAAYPGAPVESTAEQEFLRAVMLASSSPDSMLPLEIEIAERLIANFSASFKITPDQQPDIAHWIDLAAGLPPLRLARPPKHAPTLRFVAAGKATQELEQLIQSINASGALPSSLNLGGAYEPAAVIEVLRHLALYWSPKPPERQHPRHRVKSRLNVTSGFQGVYAALDPGASLDFDQGRIENWIVDDVSAGGFGASIPQLKGEWLKLGSLVGLQPEGGNNWIIGVIRRLSRDTPQKGSVGIQSLAMTAVPVKLSVGGAIEPAVLLSYSIDAVEVQFLLKAGVHVPGQNYEFDSDERSVVLMQAAVMEQGEDYELLKGKQMVRETGE
jgi:hypothetical protein